MLKTHAPIADQLTAGIGMKAAYLDSQIAELVTKTMQTDDIIVFPIHDSFIVRTAYQRWLEVVMETAFKAITAGIVSTDADGPRLSKHFGLTKDSFKEVEKEHNQDIRSGIFNVSDLDYETLCKETTMRKYLGYWEQWRALARQS